MTAVHQWLFGNAAAAMESLPLSISSGSATAGEDIVHTVTLSALPVSRKVRLRFTGIAVKGDDFAVPVGADFSNGVSLQPGGTKIIIPAGITTFDITIHTVDDLDEDTKTYEIWLGQHFGTGTINSSVSGGGGDPGGEFAGDPSIAGGGIPASGDPDDLYYFDYFDTDAADAAAIDALSPNVFHQGADSDYTYATPSGDGSAAISGGALTLTNTAGNSQSLNLQFDAGTYLGIEDFTIWFELLSTSGSNPFITTGMDGFDSNASIQSWSWRLQFTSSDVYLLVNSTSGFHTQNYSKSLATLSGKELKLVVKPDHTQEFYVDGVLDHTFTVAVGSTPSGPNLAIGPSFIMAYSADTAGSGTFGYAGAYSPGA